MNCTYVHYVLVLRSNERRGVYPVGCAYRGAGEWVFGPGAARVEHLDVGTLVTMRSGALSPHLPASQRKRARGRLAKRLVKRDAILLTKYGRKTQAAVVGKLGSLASRLALALAPPAVAPLAAAVGAAPGTINVASETEEDRACSSPSYTITKMHESIGIVKRLYNLNVAERVLPPMKVIKRVAYFAEQHGCWPDPLVVRLEDMRRESSDSPATLFRRLLYAVLTVSAGAELDPAPAKTRAPVTSAPSASSLNGATATTSSAS